ncbi:ATP-binding protein [Nocardia sp. NPDC003482]
MVEHEIRWAAHQLDGCAVVRPEGELDPITYRGFGEDLAEFAMRLPRAVIVAVDDLRVWAEPLLTIFANVWMRVGERPGVPILLVAEDPEVRGLYERSAVRRFVPVHDSVTAAVAAADRPASHRHDTLTLARTDDCARRARRFVDEACRNWQVMEVFADAELVVTELVENALAHSRAGTEISVRVELRQDLLTVAVRDDDPREAVLHEPLPGETHLYGLHVVARLAHAWGCAPRVPTGKVVWAALPTGTEAGRQFG